MASEKLTWDIWIDTGGTFTDCIAVDPGNAYRKTKVLSSSALRGTIAKRIGSSTVRVRQQWNAPSDFINGFTFKLLDHEHPPLPVTGFNAEMSTIHLDGALPGSLGSGVSFEVQSGEEAPILASRLITGTLPGEPLPPVNLRLATTKGTNALLERNGAETLFLTTAGFGDLLKIGDQRRPDLFSLQVERPDPVYREVIEVDQRLDADGGVLRDLDLEKLENDLTHIDSPESYSVAVCLMNSYRNPDHEQEIAGWLRKKGFRHISLSSTLSPFIKILPRAQTTVVNAYLEPVLQEYLDGVRNQINKGTLHVMTSAGGLESADNFHPKDSLLSGPAGGVVGASATGKQSGFERVISFDMGGTSSDVSRYDHGHDYLFEHSVGEATLSAPALSIETVAAGGGSICDFDGYKLTVGPESAGAFPGPACYGAGGPLTLTDVNLLLDRLVPDNFGIPVDRDAATERLDTLSSRISDSGTDINHSEMLEGFLDIANERMAEAIRNISLRKGYDPREYTLVTFGGAGAQHACAIAGELDISRVLVPANAGLLSAYGLGHAAVEQFAEKQLLKPLDDILSDLPDLVDRLSKQAQSKLREQGVAGTIQIRHQLLFMRLDGQDATLEIEYEPGLDLNSTFQEAYVNRYGHWVSGRDIEVESIRVVAGSRNRPPEVPCEEQHNGTPEPAMQKNVQFDGEERTTPVYYRPEIFPGQTIGGPALILDPYSTIVVEPGWKAEVQPNRTLLLAPTQPEKSDERNQRSEAVALELFTNRFTAIARDMGETLRRTALSVNVKERMDFSCALLNTRGDLVVNAPHIPVHLGALGECVRRLRSSIEIRPGDVVVTNHPAFGGSHLPDVTVVTPVYTGEEELLGYVASRAHHAEIGGTRPGSMPPDATTLAEEGVVIPPTYLVEKGEERWDRMRELLQRPPHPTRSVEENIADLQAAVAANHRGVSALLNLADRHGHERIRHYMNKLKSYASRKMKETIRNIDNGTYRTQEHLDDGTPLQASLEIQEDRITLDFDGTGPVHPGNLNATPAIVNSVVMYVLRLLLAEPLPLNEGLLEPVTIRLPRCLLNPDYPEDPTRCPAVVGGNVETSQRLVDLLLKPFEVVACSQGTMNNVLFGNDRFGYYETVGGGTGGGPGFDGTDAVHHHMTNTGATDPEILEHRYPVRLDRYAIRSESGGNGTHPGGNGIIRELTFLENVRLSVLTQHRTRGPYGLKGGDPGAAGRQWVEHKGTDTRDKLAPIDGRDLEEGDRFILHTPGGGGFGKS